MAVESQKSSFSRIERERERPIYLETFDAIDIPFLIPFWSDQQHSREAEAESGERRADWRWTIPLLYLMHREYQRTKDENPAVGTRTGRVSVRPSFKTLSSSTPRRFSSSVHDVFVREKQRETELMSPGFQLIRPTDEKDKTNSGNFHDALGSLEQIWRRLGR